MSNHRINPEEKARRVIFALTPTNLSQVDEMTNNGNRSEFIRSLIERAWVEQTIPTKAKAGSQQ